MEKLREYLADRHKADFAKAIGTKPAYLSQLLSGHRRPSYDLMVKIEGATNGEVDLHSWSIPSSDASLSEAS